MISLKAKPVAEYINTQISDNLKTWASKGWPNPHLAVILVGEDPASQVYVSHKQKGCEKLGFKSTLVRLPANANEAQLTEVIQKLNADSSVDGILLQLPLPAHFDSKKMTNLIAVQKDADSLTTASLGLLMAHQQIVSSCTPAGIIEILKFYDINVSQKNVLVIGRSLIVGLPLFHLLNQQNATVTVAHSRTENLIELLKTFDFVFVAVGKPHFLNARDFKAGATVIDVGIHRTESGLIGDVDSNGAEGYLKALTPVPGGVGPMTIAMLLQNTFKLAEQRRAGAI